MTADQPNTTFNAGEHTEINKKHNQDLDSSHLVDRPILLKSQQKLD